MEAALVTLRSFPISVCRDRFVQFRLVTVARPPKASWNVMNFLADAAGSAMWTNEFPCYGPSLLWLIWHIAIAVYVL